MVIQGRKPHIIPNIWKENTNVQICFIDKKMHNRYFKPFGRNYPLFRFRSPSFTWYFKFDILPQLIFSPLDILLQLIFFPTWYSSLLDILLPLIFFSTWYSSSLDILPHLICLAETIFTPLLCLNYYLSAYAYFWFVLSIYGIHQTICRILFGYENLCQI